MLVGMTESPEREMGQVAYGRSRALVDGTTSGKRFDETIRGFCSQLEVGIPNTDNEKALKRLRQQIDAREVTIGIYPDKLHAKLYLAHLQDGQAIPRKGYVGSSNLTRPGLIGQGELNVELVEYKATEDLEEWFNNLWRKGHVADLALKKVLDESWAGIPRDPYLVYLKMAYHLSTEARLGLVEFGLPELIESKLLEFQEAAVKIAARIVSARRGVLIGDVVGLGKTIVGTAIARLLQEDRGWETLVVCPKSLQPMWEAYLNTYGLRGEVLSLSMATRKLDKMPRHRLVLVDESHNLRNRETKAHQALQGYIAECGSHVVLLSATPYNKSVDDLDGQLSLFLDEYEDLGVRPELAIGDARENAQETEFADKCEGQMSSLAAFRQSEHLGDWQALMSQFLVRRTRRFHRRQLR